MNCVRELRLRAGMQQKEIALAAGVSRPTVSEWEHQKKDPTGERLKKLAVLFNVPTGVILGMMPVPDHVPADAGEIPAEDDLWDLREQVRRDPERRYLFSLARDASIEDVRQAVAIMDALKKTRR